MQKNRGITLLYPTHITLTLIPNPILYPGLPEGKKINFGLYFDLAENLHFQVGHALLRHCDVIH